MSANSDYKLPNVGSGDNVKAVARSARINALQNLSKEQTQGAPYSRSGVPRAIGPGFVVNRKPTSLFKGGITKFPWQMLIVTDGFGAHYVKLRPGTLNNMIPINMFDQFAIDSTNTWYVTLEANTDGYRPTTCALRADTSPPVPFDIQVNVAPAYFQVLIGVIVNLTLFQMIDSLLMATPYDVISSLTDSPQPGRPLWDLNYTWYIDTY